MRLPLRVSILCCTLIGALGAAPPTTDQLLADLADRAEMELRENILPFWLRHLPHPERDGFHGEVSAAGVPRETAPRAALMTSRILWTFSSAYRHYGDANYRAMADRAYADLTERFIDQEHGGVFWSITAAGEPLLVNKHVYGQVFALYALAEYHRAIQLPEALEQAVALFRLLETHARDHRHGGYHEAFQRDWQRAPAGARTVIGPGYEKSQNTHLHLMEAYANLLRAWPDPELRQAQQDLIEVILNRVVDPVTSHLGLYFDGDWTPRSEEISFGHDIEFAWLVTEAASELGEAGLLARVRPLAIRVAEVTLRDGVAADGGIPYEVGPQGVTAPHREWWVPAEAAVGFLNAYQLSGDDKFLRAAVQQWQYIKQHFVDREGGEWFHSLSPDGIVLPRRAKASAWKCPYHNGRACLELMTRARALLER